MKVIKILFVDDNELNRMVMEEMMKIIFPDVKMSFFQSADEILGLSLDEYSLILSDINMPHMDGLVLYKKLRDEKNYKNPIIAVTALAVSGDKEKMLMHGFDDFISKPIDMNELEITLVKYIKV